MERDPLNRAASPAMIRSLHAAQAWPPLAAARALELAAGTPPPSVWVRLLRQGLLVVGATLTLTGVIFFFAYNWADLGRFEKLGLIAAGIVACAMTAWRRASSGVGRVALFGASILVGAELAVYGQAYQTGADPYELFTAWMLLILPWTVAARSAPFFALELVLANVALSLFWVQVLGQRTYSGSGELALVLFALNACAFVVHELYSQRRGLPTGALSRALAVWTLGLLCWPAVGAAVSSSLEVTEVAAVGLLLLSVAAVSWVYGRGLRRDLFIVATVWSMALIPLDTLIGRILFDAISGLDAMPFFLLGLIVLGEVAALVAALRQLAARAPSLEAA